MGIWYKDPKHFITSTNYNIFFPSADMTFDEQLNCLMRLSLYICIIVFILKRDPNIFFVLIMTALFTFAMYSADENSNQEKQNFLEKNNYIEDSITNQYCIKPTNENPFMNVLMSDYTAHPDRPPACDVTQPKVNNDINNTFNHGLFRDVGDIFSKVASDRQYVTNPVTTIPNDREKLANWLYGGGGKKTCKEGNGDACFNLQYSPLLPT